MRILITNDDGIYAEGVLPLVQWAKTKGEVTVVAPKVEQSAKSHGSFLKKLKKLFLILRSLISLKNINMVVVQLVRIRDLGSRGRRFESCLPYKIMGR